MSSAVLSAPAIAAEGAPEGTPEEGNGLRRRLLDAARQAFVDHGYHATTMDRIAQSVGCSKKTVYKLFASKDDLFRAVMGRQRDDVIQIRPDPSLAPEDSLRDFLLRFADTILSDHSIALMRIAMAEAGRTALLGEDWCVNRPDAPRFALETYLEDLAGHAPYDFEPTLDAARMLIGMALGAVHHELMTGLEPRLPRATLKARIGRAVRIFLRGCRREP